VFDVHFIYVELISKAEVEQASGLFLRKPEACATPRNRTFEIASRYQLKAWKIIV
jgi:hypothetical protein